MNQYALPSKILFSIIFEKSDFTLRLLKNKISIPALIYVLPVYPYILLPVQPRPIIYLISTTVLINMQRHAYFNILILQG